MKTRAGFICALVWACALSVPARGAETATPTRLGITEGQFTINGEKTFLYGISYYGALGASEETIRKDLADMQRHGFNWLRVWATWAAFTNDVSAVDRQGRGREPFLGRLEWLIAECDRRNMLVDVTLSRGNGVTGPPRLQTQEAHRRAVETLVTRFKSQNNWYLDLSNERNIKDQRFTSFKDLAELRQVARKIDPKRLVTASHAGDITRDEVSEYLLRVKVDFLSPHRPRNAKSPGQTETKTREYLEMMKEVGRTVPVHYQEPFRRSFGWQPQAQDFVTDLRGALRGGAAGWCFHNGDNRRERSGRPRRSFDLRDGRLFEQLDDEEIKALASLAQVNAPATRPSPNHPGRARAFGEGVGLCVKFSQGQPRKDLALLKELGVRWVRDHSSWTRMEPAPGDYVLPEDLKERLAFYRENKIGVIFCLAYDNRKAYPPTPDDPHRNIDAKAFGRYAAATARLLKETGVQFVLELWNEPHNFVLRKQLGGEWHGGPPSPWLDHYVKMVHEAVARVKAFDPTVKVLSDEDCTIIHYRLLEAGLPRELDGLAFHPYLSKKITQPEITKEGHGAAWESPFVLADEDHSFRSMVRRLREQGEAKLGRTPELWITEFGCPVQQDVTENVTFHLGSGTEAEVAAILVRAFIGAEAAGVQAMTWFSFWDGPDGPMGLLAKNGRKRAAYTAFKTMTGQLGEYALVRQVAGHDQPTKGVQAYLFRKDEDWKLVTWIVDGPRQKLVLSGPLQNVKVSDVSGATVNPETGVSTTAKCLNLSTSPLYLSGLHEAEGIDACFATME